MVKKKPLGNLLMAASILFTGNTFAVVSRFASCFNLQFFSESVYYNTQQKYLFPVVNEAWEAKYITAPLFPDESSRFRNSHRDSVPLRGQGPVSRKSR